MMKASEFIVRKHPPERGHCFVLMPFEEGMNAVYEHGIKPLVESMGLTCRRADEMYSAQGILGDIWSSIQSTEIIIADLTGKNPNVMYELGLCHALWKRVILLSQSKEDVPFDLRAWRVIWYDFTFAGSDRLKEELRRAIEKLRGETDVESRLVPLTVTPSAPSGPTQEASPWLRGVIDSWRPDEGYGFIQCGDEGFYFNRSYLFSEAMEPSEGRRAVFRPLDPLPDTKKRRASEVFVHGTRLEGEINRVPEGKGYGFADVVGQRGEQHNMFLLLGTGADFSAGERVEFLVADNEQGPIGREVIRKGESQTS